MTGRVKYPDHLFIRVDRPLRAALLDAAAAEKTSVSEFAREALRGILSIGDAAAQASASLDGVRVAQAVTRQQTDCARSSRTCPPVEARPPSDTAVGTGVSR